MALAEKGALLTENACIEIVLARHVKTRRPAPPAAPCVSLKWYDCFFLINVPTVCVTDV